LKSGQSLALSFYDVVTDAAPLEYHPDDVELQPEPAPDPNYHIRTIHHPQPFHLNVPGYFLTVSLKKV
jgi:hypothetical protein